MFGTLSHEKEVNVPAKEAWKLYGGLELSKLAGELPHLFSKIEVVEGDGGVGTVLELFFAKGTPGMISYKEKFTVIDNSKRVKETEVVEGGYLNLGFIYFRVRLEVIEKENEKNYCTTKATIEYEVKEEAAANAAFVSIEPLALILQMAADHLVKNYKLTEVVEKKT